MKNHMILRHLYRFLPEDSGKLGCHAGVHIKTRVKLTHTLQFSVKYYYA